MLSYQIINAYRILDALLLALAGAALGSLVMPAIADALLRRKKAAHDAWFTSSADGYRRFLERHGRAPEKSAPGNEGALGVWAEDAVRLHELGELDEAQDAAVEELGVARRAEEARDARRRAAKAAAITAKTLAAGGVPGRNGKGEGR